MSKQHQVPASCSQDALRTAAPLIQPHSFVSLRRSVSQPPPARLNSAGKESVLFIFYSQCLRIADSSRSLLIEQISTNSNRVTLEQRYQRMCTRTDAYTSRPRSELCALQKPARLGLRCAAHPQAQGRPRGRPPAHSGTETGPRSLSLFSLCVFRTVACTWVFNSSVEQR